jgi:hypothetical protein
METRLEFSAQQVLATGARYQATEATSIANRVTARATDPLMQRASAPACILERIHQIYAVQEPSVLTWQPVAPVSVITTNTDTATSIANRGNGKSHRPFQMQRASAPAASILLERIHQS